MPAETRDLREVWRPGRAWSDGANCPDMIDLPLGLFAMGEHDDDKFATDLERPRHWVEIAYPIALGQYPVTAGEFAAYRRCECASAEFSLPVVGVSWKEATGYCEWLSSATGHAYRLPTEAEWEYACCAGQSRPFPCGDVLTPADANYLYDEQGHKVGPGRRTAVDTYPPNAFGLHDMAGNVCEWTADVWHATFCGAPAEGESWDEGGESGLRVIRGGAWDYLPRLLRSSWRDFLHEETCRDNVGFRVACSITENGGRSQAG